MDIVEEYIKKITLLSNLSRADILKRIGILKNESKDLSNIGALFKIKNELGLDFYVKEIQKYDDIETTKEQKHGKKKRKSAKDVREAILNGLS
jgi:hypothetical protein